MDSETFDAIHIKLTYMNAMKNWKASFFKYRNIDSYQFFLTNWGRDKTIENKWI